MSNPEWDSYYDYNTGQHYPDESSGGTSGAIGAQATWIGDYPMPSSGGFVVSGGTSLGPISTPGVQLTVSTPAPIKPGDWIVLKGDPGRVEYLVLLLSRKANGAHESLGPFAVLAAAEDAPDWAVCGVPDGFPEESRAVPLTVCRLATPEDAAFREEEKKRRDREAVERDEQATRRVREGEIRKKQEAEDNATRLRVARAREEAHARSKHRARMRLLRKYGPTLGRLVCGAAGTLLAILGLVLASR